MGRNKHKKNSAVDHWQSFPPRPMPHQQTYGYPPQYPYPQNGYYAPPVPQFIPDLWYPPQGYGPPYANMQMHPSHGYRGQINAPYPPNVQFPRSSYGNQKRNNFQHCPSSKVNWKQNAKLAKENAIKPNIKNNYDNHQLKTNRKGNYDQSQMTYNSCNKNSKKGQYNPMALLINFIKGLKTKLDSIPDQLRKTIIDEFIKNAPIERTESCTHEVNQDGQCLYCMFGYDETSRLMQMLQFLQNILQTNNKENKNKAKSQKTTEVKNKNKHVKSVSLPVQNLVDHEKPLETQTFNLNENANNSKNAGEMISEPSENVMQKGTVLANETVNDNANNINDSLVLNKLDNCNVNNLITNELNKYPDPSDQNNNKIKQDYLKKGQGLLGYQSNKVKEIVKNSKKSNENKVKINENKNESSNINELSEKGIHVKPHNKIAHENVKSTKTAKKVGESNNIISINKINKSSGELKPTPQFDMGGTIKLFRKTCNPNGTVNKNKIHINRGNVPEGFVVDELPNDVMVGDSIIESLVHAYSQYDFCLPEPYWRKIFLDKIKRHPYYGVNIESKDIQYWRASQNPGTLLPICYLQVFANVMDVNIYLYYGGGQPIIFECTGTKKYDLYVWSIANIRYIPLRLTTNDKEKIEQINKGTVYKIDNVKIEDENLLVKDEKNGEWK